MTTEICEVTVTADDAEWLASMTRTLVEERLWACGHTLSPIRSIYRWEGTIHDEPEARVARLVSILQWVTGVPPRLAT